MISYSHVGTTLLESTEGIFLSSSLDGEPEFDSTLNWVDQDGYKGYVCDHCLESIFDEGAEE